MQPMFELPRGWIKKVTEKKKVTGHGERTKTTFVEYLNPQGAKVAKAQLGKLFESSAPPLTDDSVIIEHTGRPASSELIKPNTQAEQSSTSAPAPATGQAPLQIASAPDTHRPKRLRYDPSADALFTSITQSAATSSKNELRASLRAASDEQRAFTSSESLSNTLHVLCEVSTQVTKSTFEEFDEAQRVSHDASGLTPLHRLAQRQPLIFQAVLKDGFNLFTTELCLSATALLPKPTLDLHLLDSNAAILRTKIDQGLSAAWLEPHTMCTCMSDILSTGTTSLLPDLINHFLDWDSKSRILELNCVSVVSVLTMARVCHSWRDVMKTHLETLATTPIPAMPPAKKGVQCGSVRLLGDEQAFRDSFSRFGGDELNGFNEEKLAKLGQTCRVITTYDDQTVTAVFGESVYTPGVGHTEPDRFDFPFETVAEQLMAFEPDYQRPVDPVDPPPGLTRCLHTGLDFIMPGESSQVDWLQVQPESLTFLGQFRFMLPFLDADLEDEGLSVDGPATSFRKREHRGNVEQRMAKAVLQMTQNLKPGGCNTLLMNLQRQCTACGQELSSETQDTQPRWELEMVPSVMERVALLVSKGSSLIFSALVEKHQLDDTALVLCKQMAVGYSVNQYMCDEDAHDQPDQWYYENGCDDGWLFTGEANVERNENLQQNGECSYHEPYIHKDIFPASTWKRVAHNQCIENLTCLISFVRCDFNDDTEYGRYDSELDVYNECQCLSFLQPKSEHLKPSLLKMLGMMCHYKREGTFDLLHYESSFDVFALNSFVLQKELGKTYNMQMNKKSAFGKALMDSMVNRVLTSLPEATPFFGQLSNAKRRKVVRNAFKRQAEIVEGKQKAETEYHGHHEYW